MAEGEELRERSEESVKLFVGQVPKSMTEDQLLTMFQEFALVDQVNLIKDKITRASRGFRISSSSSPLSPTNCVHAFSNRIAMCDSSTVLDCCA